MWLHIITDDKFTAGLIDMFETVASEQHVYGIRALKDTSLPTNCIPVVDEADFKDLLSSRADWLGVIFNPLAPKCWPWLRLIPKHLRVIWYAWGFEGYGVWPPLSKYLYKEKTESWVKKNSKPVSKLRSALRDLKVQYLGRRYLWRVDEFVSVIHRTHEVYQVSGLLTDRTTYRFGTVGNSFSFEAMPAEEELGKHIQLGNSATPTNNHIEAIDWLAQMELGARRVIVPLSYGSDEYRDMVCAYGKKRLGDTFQPVTDFMPFDEYKALLSQCGIMIMNTIRPQGVGNILINLMNGAKVIVNDGPVYKTLKDWGVHLEIHSDVSRETFCDPLTRSEIEANRQSVFKHASRARVIKELTDLLNPQR